MMKMELFDEFAQGVVEYVKELRTESAKHRVERNEARAEVTALRAEVDALRAELAARNG